MNSYETLKEYIKIIVSSDINLLTIKGRAGLGKSFKVIETFNELGLKKNEQYKIISGYVTPKKLFNILQEVNNLEEPKLIVFDDLDTIIKNKICLGLLKTALADLAGERIVSYESTREEIHNFNFEGKVILIANNIPKSVDLIPFLDRGIYIEMDIEPHKLYKYINENLEKIYGNKLSKEEKVSVWQKANRFIEHPRFSIRMLNRAFAFYKKDKDKWYELWVRTIK